MKRSRIVKNADDGTAFPRGEAGLEELSSASGRLSARHLLGWGAPYRLTSSHGIDIIVLDRSTPMAKSPSPTVFAPHGAIDLHVSPELRASLRELIDQKPDRLVIDLSDVPYIDSSGLAVLIGAMQSMEHGGGKFFLAAAQETVRTIFESARLDQYFHIYPTVDEAAAAD